MDDPAPAPAKERLRLLFPSEPRDFRGRRALKIVLRSLHVLFVGVFVGGVLFEVGPARYAPWLVGTLVTGGLLFLLDLFESGVFLVQVRGLVVLAKLGLLLSLPWQGERGGWILCGLLVASVFSSHASARVRYFVLFGRGRLKGARTRG